jgi:hypothetical protein
MYSLAGTKNADLRLFINDERSDLKRSIQVNRKKGFYLRLLSSSLLTQSKTYEVSRRESEYNYSDCDSYFQEPSSLHFQMQ